MGLARRTVRVGRPGQGELRALRRRGVEQPTSLGPSSAGQPGRGAARSARFSIDGRPAAPRGHGVGPLWSARTTARPVLEGARSATSSPWSSQAGGRGRSTGRAGVTTKAGQDGPAHPPRRGRPRPPTADRGDTQSGGGGRRKRPTTRSRAPLLIATTRPARRGRGRSAGRVRSRGAREDGGDRRLATTSGATTTLAPRSTASTKRLGPRASTWAASAPWTGLGPSPTGRPRTTGGHGG